MNTKKPTLKLGNPFAEMSTESVINLVAKGGMSIDDAISAATVLDDRIPKP